MPSKPRLYRVPNLNLPVEELAMLVPAGPEPLVLPAGSIKPTATAVYADPDRASWFGRKPSEKVRPLTASWLRVATKMRARCPESGEPLYGLTEGKLRVPLHWFNIFLGAGLLVGTALIFSKFARMW